MAENEDQSVTTETVPPEAPKGSAAFTAARAELAKSTPDDTPESEPAPPAEEPEKGPDQPSESPEPSDDTLLSQEELAKLTPKEREQAVKWQAKLTQKSQALAEQRKAFEQWEPLIKALQENPDDAIERMAKERGLTITKAQDTTVQNETAKQVAALPEELKFLEPVFKQFGESILQSVRGELQPIADAQTAMMTEAAAAETEATLKAFDTKYPDWKKHEATMLGIGQKFIPTTGAMTDFEYMETLYKLATADISKAEQTKKVVERINKAAASTEPETPGTSDARVEATMPADWAKMTNTERMRAAWQAASRGQVWKK